MQRRDPAGNEPAAIAALVDLDRKRVLEVGCGTGRLTRFLAARAREVHAFDPKPEAVAEARALAPGRAPPPGPVRRPRGRGARCTPPRFDLALCGWSL